MKKFLAFFSILFSLFVIFSFITVNANSAVRRVEINSYGLINVDDNPIDVLNENLTFDLYGNSASVTAEYTFHNDSDNDLNAELLFPIGPAVDRGGVVYSYNPEVYIDSSKLDTTIRLIPNSSNIIDSLSYLSDDYLDSVFDEYNIYYYEFNNDDIHEATITGGYVIPDYAYSYYYIENSILNTYRDTTTFSNFCFVLAKGDYTLTIDEGTAEFNTRVSNKQELVRKLLCHDIYEELYNYYNELDIYNIYVSNEDLYGSLAVIDYNISIAANSNCINTVKTDMKYTINTKYKSKVYEIRYYVSPASTFKSFKNLNVYLNSDMYLISNNIKLAKQKDGSYKVSYKKLIDKEIDLALSYDKSVKNAYNNSWILGTILVVGLAALGIFIIVIVFAALGIVALVFAIKKKKINKNILHFIQTVFLLLSICIFAITMLNDDLGIKLFGASTLIIPFVLGIIQLIFDIKNYKYQAIIFDSIVLAGICISCVLKLFSPDYFSAFIITSILYLFNLAYLFFKSNFLKEKENIAEIGEEPKNDDSISVESNDDEKNDSKDNE